MCKWAVWGGMRAAELRTEPGCQQSTEGRDITRGDQLSRKGGYLESRRLSWTLGVPWRVKDH